MLINAQVENATVMATLQNWNKHGRYVHGGERSIAFFTSRTDTSLKYLFGISQTYGKPIMKRWDLQDPQQQERLIERYNTKYDTDHAQISDILNSIYNNAMMNIRNEVQETLRGYQLENAATVEKLIADSALCLMMSRYGYEFPEDNLNFSAISTLKSDSLIIAVGNLSMKAAHEALLEIENAIRRKDYEVQRDGLGIRNEGRTVLSQDGNAQGQSGNERQDYFLFPAEYLSADLPGYALELLLTLYMFSFQDSFCIPSFTQISQASRLSSASIVKGYKVLEEKGIIVKENYKRKDGSKGHNRYFLVKKIERIAGEERTDRFLHG